MTSMKRTPIGGRACQRRDGNANRDLMKLVCLPGARRLRNAEALAAQIAAQGNAGTERMSGGYERLLSAG